MDASASPAVSRRRSQRVLIQIRVGVRGRDTSGNSFREETFTKVVNAHGALIMLEAEVGHGRPLALENLATHHSEETRVVFLGQKEAGKAQVGLEFTRPAPHFWGIEFPPEDWKPFARWGGVEDG